MCIKYLNKLQTLQDIDSKETRKMLTVLANTSIKRTLFSVSTLSPMIDSLAKYQNQMGLIALQEFCYRWCKREHVESNALNSWKLNIFKIIDGRISFYCNN